jgi:hypothetical protein
MILPPHPAILISSSLGIQSSFPPLRLMTTPSECSLTRSAPSTERPLNSCTGVRNTSTTSFTPHTTSAASQPASWSTDWREFYFTRSSKTTPVSPPPPFPHDHDPPLRQDVCCKMLGMIWAPPSRMWKKTTRKMRSQSPVFISPPPPLPPPQP